MTAEQFLGIDFSGSPERWKRRDPNPTVWIATLRGADAPQLVDLRPVQALPGEAEPFDRLTALLRAGGFAAAAIDAPFSIPAPHLPPGGHAELLRRVAALPVPPGRPFPEGGALLRLAIESASLSRPKPLRDTERLWRGKGVSVRSTLWTGPRPGAPFAVACLLLLARAGRPVWPWEFGPGLLAEAFPAAQLRAWELPHQGYGRPEQRAVRALILERLSQRVGFDDAQRTLMLERPDALDATLAAFAAIAAVKEGPVADSSPDGRIAVLEGAADGAASFAAPVVPVPARAAVASVDSGRSAAAWLRERLALSVPIIQAPMAGVSTLALAAAVSEAGGLGSIGVGATDAAGAAAMTAALRARTGRAFNVNLFVHRPAEPDPARENAWLRALSPAFAEFGAAPPPALRQIYRSFEQDGEMLALLLHQAPPVVSFHFGLPPPDALAALRARGCLLLATATSLEEARRVEAAGIDAVVAQGIEAGGHRGVFDPLAPDDGLGTIALVRLLVRETRLPVIAAGGIMDGAGIAAALSLGAAAAQLGTAFVACPESGADAGYRTALAGPGAHHTRLTAAISGRPARTLGNRFTALSERLRVLAPPDYPIAYDAGKALHAAASARGEQGFGAHWAGQGAPLSRPMPASALVALLAKELSRHRGWPE